MISVRLVARCCASLACSCAGVGDTCCCWLFWVAVAGGVSSEDKKRGLSMRVEKSNRRFDAFEAAFVYVLKNEAVSVFCCSCSGRDAETGEGETGLDCAEEGADMKAVLRIGWTRGVLDSSAADLSASGSVVGWVCRLRACLMEAVVCCDIFLWGTTKQAQTIVRDFSWLFMDHFRCTFNGQSWEQTVYQIIRSFLTRFCDRYIFRCLQKLNTWNERVMRWKTHIPKVNTERHDHRASSVSSLPSNKIQTWFESVGFKT